MKIGLVGPKQRGLAMGLNEFAGYVAVAASALATGWIAARYGLRPQPFYLGVVFAIVGLALSAFLVRETRHHVSHESVLLGTLATDGVPTPREVFWRTTLLDANLSSVSQAGLVSNLNDGMAWGLFPLVFAAAGMNLAQVGLLAAVYPATWGFGQLVTGALSDRTGRKPLIVWGMWIQADGIGVVTMAHAFAWFVIGAVLLGIGTAMACEVCGGCTGCITPISNSTSPPALASTQSRSCCRWPSNSAWSPPSARLLWPFWSSRCC